MKIRIDWGDTIAMILTGLAVGWLFCHILFS